jgi:hypothetical protein
MRVSAGGAHNFMMRLFPHHSGRLRGGIVTPPRDDKCHRLIMPLRAPGFLQYAETLSKSLETQAVSPAHNYYAGL